MIFLILFVVGVVWEGLKGLWGNILAQLLSGEEVWGEMGEKRKGVVWVWIVEGWCGGGGEWWWWVILLYYWDC